MCGIVGQFNFGDGTPADPALLRHLAAALTHRGPDDSGVHIDGALGLAHRRLSIVDVAGGHQPLANEDNSIWITFNGEIYNCAELRDELQGKGHKFRTRSDTEVIVHAYEEFGIAALARLNGIFALALWDSQKRTLILARDPFGVKPLYVWTTNRAVVFSSELKAFLQHPLFEPEISPEALDAYLTYEFVPSPLTMLKGVTKLRPGHWVGIDGSGNVRDGRFARRGVGELSTLSEGEAEDELARLIPQAVRRQMMSDVPIGALLSGGIDSAVVVALMREHARSKVHTYTVGFEGAFHDNELVEARRTAELLDTDHHEVVLSRQGFFETLDCAVWQLDEPIGTPSALAMNSVSARAARDVKVVLTGQGADEPWAGYRRYRGEKIGSWYRRIPGWMRRTVVQPLIESAPRAEAAKRAVRSLGLDDAVERFTGVYTAFTPADKRELFKHGHSSNDDASGPVQFWLDDVPALPPLSQQLYIESRLSLPDNLLMYGDKMSMAYSLEARVPLLDLELMDFVERLPSHYRLRGWRGHKHLYRKALARWVPREVLQRRKIGFATPVDQWFRSDRGRFLRERLLESSVVTRHFSRAYMQRLIDDHVSGRLNHSRHLYTLLIFAVWSEAFLTTAATRVRRDAANLAVR